MDDFDSTEKEGFIEKFGEITPDGTPRFGEDYEFLVAPEEFYLRGEIEGIKNALSPKPFFESVKDFFCF